MKILLCCPHFEPDHHAATGKVMTKLVENLAMRGHKVTVVTSLPWYKEHSVYPEWRGRLWRTEKTSWGKIIRVYPFPTDKNSIVRRSLAFFGFTALASIRALFSGKHDVVMGMSPPIFIGEAAYLSAKRSRAPFVFNTQDIFPDVAVDLGALTNGRVISAASRYERSLYRRSDAVTVLSADQFQNVANKVDKSQRSKIVTIPNFVDVSNIRPTDRNNFYRKDLGIEEAQRVVMYSGNVGLSQSFDLVQAAAIHFRDRNDVTFVINGEGAARAEVDKWAEELPNVIVQDFGPQEQLSEILATGDIHLILLKKGLAKSSTPSKLYGILAASRPILASIDENSEVAVAVSDSQAGSVVPPDSPDEFVSALEKMLAMTTQELQQLGEAGLRHAKVCMTPEMQAEAYEQLFQTLVDRPQE